MSYEVSSKAEDLWINVYQTALFNGDGHEEAKKMADSAIAAFKEATK